MNKKRKPSRRGPLRWEHSYRLLSIVAQNPNITAEELQLEGASVGIEVSIRTAFRFLQRYRSADQDDFSRPKSHLRVVADILQNAVPGERVTPFDIKERALEQGRSLHLSTVYRILYKLVMAGTLIQQDVGGKKFYEWKRKGNPEARIICTTCGATIEFEKDYLRGMAESICSSFDYRHERLELVLYASCRHCRVAK